jgi:predicted CXXCH cytochrome family protein
MSAMSAITCRSYMRIKLRQNNQGIRDHKCNIPIYIGYFLGALVTIVFFSGLSLAGDYKKSAHGNKSLLPKGCISCHKGHGVRGTALLSAVEKDFCLLCHGTQTRQREAMKTRKLTQGKVLKNIEDDFKKAYHHPIEKEGIHSSKEVLPEKDSSALRHASCMDCHSPHKVRKNNLTAGVDGAKRGAQIKARLDNDGAEDVKEHEICYKCHSYSANLPPKQKNKELEFDPDNASFHPVEAEGKNSNVPSLILPLTTSSRIKCSDCHGADGYNAPKGPHGSTYEHILKKKYVESEKSSESVLNYELCYSCHKREYILRTDGWRHGMHVKITSCKTCHNSHGSKVNRYLIDFDPIAVTPNKEAVLEFRPEGKYGVSCSLKCHEVEHIMKSFESTVSRPRGKYGK